MSEHDDNILQNEPDADVSYTQKVFEFLHEKDLDDIEPVFYLYKYDSSTSGNSKTTVERYQCCEPPDEDHIGRLYGSGRYMVVMAVPPREGEKGGGYRKSYRFKLHERYDEIAARNFSGARVPVVVPPAAAPQKQDGLTDAFAIIERMVALLSPFVIPLLSRPKDENVQAIMQDTYSSVNKLLYNSMMENVRMNREIKNKMNEVNEGMGVLDQAVEPEKGPSVFEQVLPLISEWIPKLLGGGVQGQAVGQLVRMTPQFQQIVNDKGEFDKIVSYLVKTQGVEKTNEVLGMLGINKRIPAPGGNGSVVVPGKKPGRGLKQTVGVK